MKNILLVGSVGSGKSTTIGALLKNNATGFNKTHDALLKQIDRYDTENEIFWDADGFGESIENDLILEESIVSLIRRENNDGERVVNTILIVVDLSTRDLGTEYKLISDILMPNLGKNQNIIIGLNQCDFAMKGKNWDSEKNEPNENLKSFLRNKVLSIKERLKESTGLDIEPIYFSALYGYNIDKLYQCITNDMDVERFNNRENTVDDDSSSNNVKTRHTLSQQVEEANKAHMGESLFTANDNFAAIRSIDEVCISIENELEKADINYDDRKLIIERLTEIKNQELNIMLVGGTGAGKSSTINALFGENVAVVGESVNPQTDKIEKYSLSKVTLWDTPGLGDSPQADERYSKQIIDMLNENNSVGKRLIDVVLVVIDASAQELGTSYRLINDVIMPNVGDERRVLIALNQCDFAMKGKYWDHATNTPKPRLESFLREKAMSVSGRIKESTGVEVVPVYYSALYKYNIAKLFFYLLDSTPDEKRINLIPQMNKNVRVWDKNDSNYDYKENINKTARESYQDTFSRVFRGIPKDFMHIIFNVVDGFVDGFIDIMRKHKR